MDKIVIVAGALLIFACNTSGSSVEGIYTRYSTGEYSKANDTLIVYSIDRTHHSCLVRRKTAYIRISSEIEQPVQYKTEEMLTVYDPSTERLTDPKTGRMFLFHKNELVFGTAIYKKQ